MRPIGRARVAAARETGAAVGAIVARIAARVLASLAAVVAVAVVGKRARVHARAATRRLRPRAKEVVAHARARTSKQCGEKALRSCGCACRLHARAEGSTEVRRAGGAQRVLHDGQVFYRHRDSWHAPQVVAYRTMASCRSCKNTCTT